MLDLSRLAAGTFVGVDPGSKGAVAVLTGGQYPGGTVAPHKVKVARFDDLTDLQLFRLVSSAAIDPDRVAVEKVHGVPKQSGPASFNFGHSVGVAVGAAMSLCPQRTHRIEKKEWAFLVGIPFEDRANKQVAKDLALKLFPDAFVKNRLGNIHEGEAEAVLIALAMAVKVTKQKEEMLLCS